jgi:hypothetical protein
VRGTTILIRRQINSTTLGAVLKKRGNSRVAVPLLCIVPYDETVDPGGEEVVDEDHGLQHRQHGGAHTHPAHQGSSSFFPEHQPDASDAADPDPYGSICAPDPEV